MNARLWPRLVLGLIGLAIVVLLAAIAAHPQLITGGGSDPTQVVGALTSTGTPTSSPWQLDMVCVSQGWVSLR